MTDELSLKDPLKRQPLTIKTVKVSELEVVRHQRKPRPAHIKGLTASIEKLGFLVPLIVVQEESNGKTRYVIIDGQHRFEAAKSVGVKQFPVIVVPPDLSTRMMNFNVEKDLNIREKSFISLSIYRGLLEEDPDLPENDAELVDSIVTAHFVTLGLSYEKSGRLAGSSYEPILKKCDGFLKKPLNDAMKIREQRSQSVIEADKIVKRISKQLKERGVTHSFVTQQILSYANPFKRKRGAVEFEDAFSALIKRLSDLDEHPEKVLKEPVGG
jgi:ParB family chromosome partitioning protein